MVDILGAIQMLANAWNGMKTNTIVNCLRKAGFVVAPDGGCLDNDGGWLDSESRKLLVFPGGSTVCNFYSTVDGCASIPFEFDISGIDCSNSGRKKSTSKFFSLHNCISCYRLTNSEKNIALQGRAVLVYNESCQALK